MGKRFNKADPTANAAIGRDLHDPEYQRRLARAREAADRNRNARIAMAREAAAKARESGVDPDVA